MYLFLESDPFFSTLNRCMQIFTQKKMFLFRRIAAFFFDPARPSTIEMMSLPVRLQDVEALNAMCIKPVPDPTWVPVAPHERFREVMMDLVRRVRYEQESNAYFQGRTLWGDKMERLAPSIPLASLSMKEKRARHSFDVCLDHIPAAALQMARLRERRVFRTNVVPTLLRAAKANATKHIGKASCLPWVVRVGGVKSAQRNALAFCLVRELPCALVERDMRECARARKRSALVEFLNEWRLRRETLHLLESAEMHERCMGELRTRFQTPIVERRSEASTPNESESVGPGVLPSLVMMNFVIVGLLVYGAAAGISYTWNSVFSSVAPVVNEWRIRKKERAELVRRRKAKTLAKSAHRIEKKEMRRHKQMRKNKRFLGSGRVGR